MNKTQDIVMIGSAHIDPAWLWRWTEGYAEVKATFRSALDRLSENPGFIFTCACAAYYEWIEQQEPEMFSEIAARVREGRWKIVGGMWIQPDMNAPSTASMARQLSRSVRYFREKFGAAVKTGYNVDSFGHAAFVPNLLRAAGIQNYVWMRPQMHENPDIPQGPMTWRAPAGQSVTAFRIPFEYTCYGGVPDKIQRTSALGEQMGMPMMCFYGVGNHGGGPTIENLREIDDFMGQKSDIPVSYGDPDAYFDLLSQSEKPLPLWEGELQHHASGCYSTHSRTKALHRRAENALLRAEKLGSLALARAGHRPDEPFMQRAWDDLLFNEFHDLMGGCATERALSDMAAQLESARAQAQREANAAMQRVSWRIDTQQGNPLRARSKEEMILWHSHGQGAPIVVFNPHGFDAKWPVKLNQAVDRVTDESGREIPCQHVAAEHINGERDRTGTLFTADVPAMGWRLYWVYRSEGARFENPLTAAPTLLENALIRAEFDPDTGELVRLTDKRDGGARLGGACEARLVDISHTDTWAHNIFSFDRDAGSFAGSPARVLEAGPVRAALVSDARFGESTLRRRYFLYADSDCLMMEAELNLRQEQRMVKMRFPLAAPEESACAEVMGGLLRRAPDGREEHCQRFVAQGGLAVINDGRYSYSANPGEIDLTVAHASVYADHYAQAYRTDQSHYMDMEPMTFRVGLKPYRGRAEDAGLWRDAALINQGLPHVQETYHEGPLGSAYRGVRIAGGEAELLTLKRSDAEDGYEIQLQEMAGRACKLVIELPMAGRAFDMDMTPFALGCAFVPDDAGAPVGRIDLAGRPI